MFVLCCLPRISVDSLVTVDVARKYKLSLRKEQLFFRKSVALSFTILFRFIVTKTSMRSET